MSAEHSRASEVEFSKDNRGNLWFAFSGTETTRSLLHGLVPEVAVITPEGRSLVTTDNRRKVIRGIANGGLPVVARIDSGSEGVVHKVDPTNVKGLHALIPRILRTGLVVEKTYHKVPEIDHSLGWESLVLFDALRPSFEKNGFNLVNPLGATNRSLFLPFIDSKSLYGFFRRFKLTSQILPVFLSELAALEDSLSETITNFMTGRGYKVEPQTNIDKRLKCVAGNGEEVRFLLDVRRFEEDSGYFMPTFRNWLLSKKDIREVKECMGSPVEVYAMLKQKLVCVDPILARRFPQPCTVTVLPFGQS